MQTNPRWDSVLTVRTPDATNAEEVYAAIQAEIIRPLTKILGPGCRICGQGATTAYNGHHAHVLICSTKPLPLIDAKQDPVGYERIRQQLREVHGRKAPILGNGRHVIELTPTIDQAAAYEYMTGHLERYSDAQTLIFNQRQLRRLYGQLQAAA